MKKVLLFSFLFSITILLTSYKVVINKINADVLSVLGFSKSLSDELVLWSLSNGLGPIIRPENMVQFISKSSAEKTEISQQFCVYIKSYVYSQEFKDNYETYRQSKKPVVRQLSEDEKLAMRDAIAQQEEIFTHELLEMFPESAEGALASIADSKAELNGEMTSAQKAEWEKKVPADPYINIKKGLQTFLDDTKDIDYKAPTELNNYNGKIFTNPAYENKPAYWKACYRAGREVAEAGRNFAKEWLAELK